MDQPVDLHDLVDCILGILSYRSFVRTGSRRAARSTFPGHAAGMSGDGVWVLV